MSNATPPRQWPPVGRAPAMCSSSSQRPSTPDFWWNPRTNSVYVGKIPDSDSNLAISSLGNLSLDNARVETSKACHTGKDAGPSKSQIKNSNKSDTTKHAITNSDTVVTHTHSSVSQHLQKAASTKDRKVAEKSHPASSHHTRTSSGGNLLSVTSHHSLGHFSWERVQLPVKTDGLQGGMQSTNPNHHKSPTKR